MLKLFLFFLYALNVSAQQVPRDDQLVNDHLNRTNSKMAIQRSRAHLENQKTAPSLDRTPTYDDPSNRKNYGVDMQQKLPFDDLDLDHMDPEKNYE